MTYIKRISTDYLETVDEFDCYSEAKEKLEIYRAGDFSCHYYLSVTPCQEWGES